MAPTGESSDCSSTERASRIHASTSIMNCEEMPDEEHHTYANRREGSGGMFFSSKHKHGKDKSASDKHFEEYALGEVDTFSQTTTTSEISTCTEQIQP